MPKSVMKVIDAVCDTLDEETQPLGDTEYLEVLEELISNFSMRVEAKRAEMAEGE